MRYQITFTTGKDWAVDPHPENLARARFLTRPPYDAKVEEIHLAVNFKRSASDSPFRERCAEERAVAIDISLKGLAEYLADFDVVATIVAQTQWDASTDGETITHHIFLSEPVEREDGDHHC